MSRAEANARSGRRANVRSVDAPRVRKTSEQVYSGSALPPSWFVRRGIFGPVTPVRRDSMAPESPVGSLSKLSAPTHGVIRGPRRAPAQGHAQSTHRASHGRSHRTPPPRYLSHDFRALVERAVAPSCAPLGWQRRGGRGPLGRRGVRTRRSSGRAAGDVVPRSKRVRSDLVRVHGPNHMVSQMTREYRGVRTTGIEATLIALAADLGNEALEIACEDARRRRLTSVSALRAYIARFGRSGMRGIERDPRAPRRDRSGASVAVDARGEDLTFARGQRIHGLRARVPARVEWTHLPLRLRSSAAARSSRSTAAAGTTIDDPTDYERDNDKRSVPGRHGYRIVFATWAKVTKYPDALLEELDAALAASTARIATAV